MAYSDEQGFSTSVVLVNVKIGFWRLVTLLIKIFVASVPALIIAWFLVGLILASFFGVLAMLGYHPERVHPWLMEQWRMQEGVAPQ